MKLKRIISRTKAIAVVEKQVRIRLKHDHTCIGHGIYYDFDLQLSHRGTDFGIYANVGYNENTRDTDLLASIANALMTPRSGVTSIEVRAFGLMINISSAVTTAEIEQALLDAAHRAGYMVDYANLDEKRGRLVNS